MTVCFNSLLAFRSHTKESMLHSFVCLLTSTHNTRRSCSGKLTMQLSLRYIVNIISIARTCSLTASSMNQNVNAEICMFAIVTQSVKYYHTLQNFCDRKISRIAAKRGAEIFATKIFAKAALIHCVTWLICSSVRLVGSLTVDESFSVFYTVACLQWIHSTHSANVLQEQRVSFKKVQAQLALIVIA